MQTAVGFVTPTQTPRALFVGTAAHKEFPYPAACIPTKISDWASGCVHAGNWIKNPGFEDCIATPTVWTFNYISNVDTVASGITVEDFATGSKSFKVVFLAGGGSLGIKFTGTNNACELLNYRLKLSHRQLATGCRLEYWWGGANQGTTSDITSAWSTYDAPMYSPFRLMQLNLYGDFEIRIICTQGGASAALFLDDIYLGNDS